MIPKTKGLSLALLSFPKKPVWRGYRGLNSPAVKDLRVKQTQTPQHEAGGYRLV